MFSYRKENKGVLVAIEGIDGAGKTTVSRILAEKLKELGHPAEYTYEPFASPFSEALRIYIDTYGEAEPEIETLAMALDRLFHIKKVVEPLLNRGYIVITDRYVYSSIAYQGARGVDTKWIESVNRYAIQPDIAIYLRVPLEIALERVKDRKPRWKYFEDVNRLRKVQEIYESLVSQGILIPIDASQDLEKVVSKCLNIILKHVEKH